MSTLTPNYGLIVPETTDTVAQVRADYATNLGKIDNISGGGGGGGFDFGAFINTNQIIQSQTAFRSSMTYTATEDCFVMFYIVLGVGSTYINIDGDAVSTFYNTQTVGDTQGLYLRKGQIISVSNANAGVDSHYIVYGLMQGTQGVFSPVIYSDNERLVGIWRDNKPLYQRSFAFTINVSSGQTATIATLTDYENIISLDGWINESNIFYSLNDYSARIKVNASGQLQFTSASGSSWNGSGYITVTYTKASDVAGSGDWNTDGVPTVHYSTSEQVIGTWTNGKPLYRQTINFSTGNVASNIDFNIDSYMPANCVVVRSSHIIEFTYSGTTFHGVNWGGAYLNMSGTHYFTFDIGSAVYNKDIELTIEYTKTTD